MDKKEMLLEVAKKSMFNIDESEMDALINEYDVFMHHVEVLEGIDTTNVEPLNYPYDIETTFLREDVPTNMIDTVDALRNAKSVLENQIKVPKVVD